ncbi:hypothetical protein AB4Z01_28990 [Inquilinus sp. YAF38]|uniref:hypothetical protein n=1 Tax=Inquilinus sp. YAF38 TaxID=3233084 RepID=UPI003F90599F
MCSLSWLSDNKDAFDAISAIITSVAVLIGGGWAVNRFIIRREFASQVEFNVDIEFIGIHSGYWIIEIVAIVNNKDGSHLKMHEFTFKLRSIEDQNLEIGGKKVNYQTIFPHALKDGSWFPLSWESTMLEPNTVVRYSHVAHIPVEATFLLLHGRIGYFVGFIRKAPMFHTADRAFRVPAAPS